MSIDHRRSVLRYKENPNSTAVENARTSSPHPDDVRPESIVDRNEGDLVNPFVERRRGALTIILVNTPED